MIAKALVTSFALASCSFFQREEKVARGQKEGKKAREKEEEPRTEEDSGEVRDGFSNYDAVVRTPSA